MADSSQSRLSAAVPTLDTVSDTEPSVRSNIAPALLSAVMLRLASTAALVALADGPVMPFGPQRFVRTHPGATF